MGFAGVCLGVGCNSGCSGASAAGGPTQTAAGSDGTSQAASGSAASPGQGQEMAGHGAPPAHAPHHFTARAASPRHRPAPPPPPHVHALPAFVDNTARCFPERYQRYTPPPPYVPPHHHWNGPTTGGAGTRYGAGLGSNGSAPEASAAAPAQPRAAAPARPSASAPSGSRRTVSGSEAGKGKASSDGMVAESAPRPAPSPAASAPPPPPAERKAEASEGANKRRSRDDRELAVHEAPPADWGAAIYLSNDDSMSLSSAQRVIWAIDRYEPIPRAHVRPHELLNYFSFQTAPVPHERDFSVVANIEPKPSEAGIYSLALAVQGRPLTTDTRRNVNLSYVIDRSGSMADEGRMDYLKRGLLRSLAELKHGDIVHLVLFDSSACTLAQNFVVGRDSHQRLADLIRQIEPRGATNVHEGLSQGYAVADAAYQPAYTNRVVLVTDALTNTGVTDQGLISMVGRNYDARRIRLSGVGVGSEFNDSLLDELTERGRGAYVFLGSEAEVDAVFGSRFVSLIETVANDVHFRLHLPPSLAMNVFYGEEASTQKERVQAIHYFANTSQLFLSDLKTRYGGLSTQDDIMLTIEYEDPETLTKQVEEYAFNLGTILGESRNVRKAQLVNRFVRAVGSMAERPMPAQYAYRPAAWYDDGAWSECAVVRNELASLAQGQQDDPEVLRVQGLWDRFCGRYATPAEPPPPVHRPLPPRPLPHVPPPVRSNDYPPPPLQRNNDYAPPDSWPSAQR